MCAAVAAPVSPVKVSRNLILRPVTVAVKVPDPFAPFGAGISWLTVKNAFSFAVVTRGLVDPDEAASDDADTISATESLRPALERAQMGASPVSEQALIPTEATKKPAQRGFPRERRETAREMVMGAVLTPAPTRRPALIWR